MKIKTISRDKGDYVKERKGDIDQVYHNIDSKYHPFQQQREVLLIRKELIVVYSCFECC